VADGHNAKIRVGADQASNWNFEISPEQLRLCREALD